MRVKLVSFTPEPLKVAAYVKKIIEGKHVELSSISDEEAELEFIDTLKSSILSPFEFINFVFDFQDVPRAFTHQHVRTRSAVYMQESLRFSTREEGKFKFETGPTIEFNENAKRLFNSAMEEIGRKYWELIQMGVATEDARGVLPINILTGIAQGINYRSLIATAEQRLCLQSQPFHRKVFLEIKAILTKEVHPLIGKYLAPSCSHNGFCSWGGRLDRPCPLQKIYPMKPAPFDFILREGDIVK